ncbi:hypothetical protein NPIL_663711 [Nephila pilipes]|uniref:Uncharacterized protein n=1 Tax=Nephila pilipes TaxID=299642 RepID=A0A8X6QYR0_NEPPI|nr:hypothetical protein NPIL_663711 [Nephila pilipes]
MFEEKNAKECLQNLPKIIDIGGYTPDQFWNADENDLRQRLIIEFFLKSTETQRHHSRYLNSSCLRHFKQNIKTSKSVTAISKKMICSSFVTWRQNNNPHAVWQPYTVTFPI